MPRDRVAYTCSGLESYEFSRTFVLVETPPLSDQAALGFLAEITSHRPLALPDKRRRLTLFVCCGAQALRGKNNVADGRYSSSLATTGCFYLEFTHEKLIRGHGCPSNVGGGYITKTRQNRTRSECIRPTNCKSRIAT